MGQEVEMWSTCQSCNNSDLVDRIKLEMLNNQYIILGSIDSFKYSCPIWGVIFVIKRIIDTVLTSIDSLSINAVEL